MSGQYQVTVVDKETITPEIYRLTLAAPAIAASARPGQFVMLRTGSNPPPLLNRPFSVHWVTDDGHLGLLFKVVGEGTRRLASLQPGDVLTAVGPLGQGFTWHNDNRPCLVGGGMGIAPLYMLARELLASGQQPSAIDLLLGARCRAEVAVLRDDFAALGLSPQIATDDGSLGHAGLVPELLEALLYNPAGFTAAARDP
ncbi:MAG: FAD-binding oxidoreductase [Desulfurivibrio sp.]|nr:FAD-binding oxidoreductase [Desulfurivibrio sp.]